ncbi:MAG: fused MFS/spermidine synthase [Gemmataceae bacterium]|nr:fused MFS/spermidine synthase [Gemmataceae bacterium]MDW8265406.1 fused MFS/spermidine synthase [Gemmataceae bacterium]
MTPLLYSTTLFLSAALLFCVQPMVAKMLLPLLGGSPAVWNTCMVFFQAALLAGYLEAHLLGSRAGLRAQVLLQGTLMLLPLAVLPIGIGPGALAALPTETSPIPWLLSVLLVSVGLPFFVVSSLAPLLQRWFAASGDLRAHDPYFLYAASNLGSMLALLSYPVVIEPLLPVREQSRLWAWGYGVLVVAVWTCGLVLWRKGSAGPEPGPADHPPADERIGWGRRLRWVSLAVVPSGLMLAVTLYITTNLAAVPLLWILPLSLYLLSFIMVFASRPPLRHEWVSRLAPVVVVLLACLLLAGPLGRAWQFIPVHLFGLFVIALFCHGELACDRPAPARLTEFYLWLSFGGMLGGLCCSLLAPVVFQRLGVIEYPLLVLATGLLLPGVGQAWRPLRLADVGLPLALGAAAAALFLGPRWASFEVTNLHVVLFLAVLVAIGLLQVQHPVRLVASLAAVSLVFGIVAFRDQTQWTERNFFGVVHVQQSPNGYRQLVHGNTIHGIQNLDPSREFEPLAYFHRAGPIGQLMQAMNDEGRLRRVAVAGLGIGALAWYARPGQEWTFYEIDPAIARLASDPNYFAFLDRCAVRPRIVLGDARLNIHHSPDGAYDLIVLDAFSSDSIPVHLLTVEAFRTYLAKLAEGGVIAINISNNYLDLKPVIAQVAAHAAEKPLVALSRDDLDLDDEQRRVGRWPSQWVALARREDDLGPLVRDPQWRRLEPQPGRAVWTDDFSNIFGVLRWR